MNKSTLSIAVVTQEDLIAIPKNVEKLCKKDFIDVKCVTVIKTKAAIESKRWKLIFGFGVKQAFQMMLFNAALLARAFCASIVRAPTRWMRLRDLAKAYDVSFLEIGNPNTKEYVEMLKTLDVDLVVSYSAPMIFKSDLLSAPRYGCINLHCSALPSYAGVMPSFWAQLSGEDRWGVSVHLMDNLIDNGDVLAQEFLSLKNIRSMTEHIRATKDLGGDLMLEVLNYISIHKELPKSIDVTSNPPSYFKWPQPQDFKRFRNLGCRLI